VSEKTRPGLGIKTYSYKNGEEIFISRTYLHNGKYWGMLPDSHGRNRGWIPMDQLLVMYIRDDFAEEYREEFYTYSGNYDAALAADKLVLWEWPGSDRAKRILDYGSYDDRDSFYGRQARLYKNADTDIGLRITDISANYAYKDKDGREWGYVDISYTYIPLEDGIERFDTGGVREWICLSDPENSDIPAFNPAPTPTKWESDVYPIWFIDKLLVTVFLVFVLIVLIRIHRKSNNFTF